jgi:hypothetical protein
MKKTTDVYIVYIVSAVLLVSCFFTGGPGRLWAQEMSAQQLQETKEAYGYADWRGETGKVIAGLDISGALLPQLEGMSKKWKTDDFSIERLDGTTYTKIRKWWTAPGHHLEVAMVVCPTFTAAKEYLISRYAYTQMASALVRPTGDRLGLNLGGICYAIPVKQGTGFIEIDFIHHNVLIMMRAEGGSVSRLAAAAAVLDNALASKETKGKYSGLKDIPAITGFSCEKASIKQGETVLLNLEVANPGGHKLHYSWDVSGGGVRKAPRGKFVYYGGETGVHTITVTVLNALGLHDARTLQIEVER